MNSSKTMRSVLLWLALAATAAAAPAYAQVRFNVNIGPPPLQYEIVPAMAPGYVWAPGYWGWTGERHVWVRGRSIVQRTGYIWAPDRWEQRNSGYFRNAGHWEQDRAYRPERTKMKKGGHDNGNRGRGNNGRRGRDD
jgi:hypothetical protein